MEQWEYFTTYIEANVKGRKTRKELQKRFGKRKIPRYMVESLLPELNKYGAEGWEIIHMEPVPGVGKRGDVLFARRWSNTYFCVFKRRKGVLRVKSEGNGTQATVPPAPTLEQAQTTPTPAPKPTSTATVYQTNNPLPFQDDDDVDL